MNLHAPKAFIVGFFILSIFIIPNHAKAATFDQSGCASVDIIEVGPGKQRTELKQVPWHELGGCTTVRVYPKNDFSPYPEQILISAGSDKAPTAPDKWFKLEGITVNGHKPVITGVNATQQETVIVNGQSKTQSLQYIDNNNPGRILYKLSTVMISPQAGYKYGTMPQYIMIDNLEIRGAYEKYTFTDEKTHTTVPYNDFAAGVFAHYVKHFILSNCTLTDNSIGLMVNSINNFPGSTSEDILIRGNTFINNGRLGDFHEHHSYTQAKGAIFEYNFYGNIRSGAPGQSLKSRDSDITVRYNTFYNDVAVPQFNPGQFIWLTPPDGSPDIITADPNYDKAFIYGNTFIDKGAMGGLLFTDRGSDSTVYFYDNTVLNQRDPKYGQFVLFLATGDTTISTVDARNNIFAAEPHATGMTPTTIRVFQNPGTINFSQNVTTPNIIKFNPWKPNPAAMLNGWETNITIPNNNNAGVFQNLGNLDLHLKDGSPAIGASTALHPTVTANSKLVQNEYVSVGQGAPRGSMTDIGAFAFGGQNGGISLPQNNPTPPAPPVTPPPAPPVTPPPAPPVTPPPALSLVAQIPASTEDTTPSFTFSSTKAGTLKFVGSCPTPSVPMSNAAILAGSTIVTFGPLPVGSYSNCSITVIDADGLVSNTLGIANFKITSNGSGVITDPIKPPTDLLSYLKSVNLSIGSLIKLPDDGNASTQQDSAVYYVGEDGKRHAFPHVSVYFTWFADFSKVQIFTPSILSNIPLGKNVRHRPGIKLVKFTTDPKVYAVDTGAELRWVKTEAAAQALYGSNWNKNILDISDAFFTDFSFNKGPISTASDFPLAQILANTNTIQNAFGF